MAAHGKFVPDLSVGFELAVVWAATVTSDQSPVLVFDRVLLRNIRIHNLP